jgi:competence protein ComEC
LDVGQGLAVLIEQEGAFVLYDTGPAWSTGSAEAFVISPLLQWFGAKQLDGLILSHLDNDHAGGRESIEQRWHPTWKYSSHRLNSYHPCVIGQDWDWKALHFSVLWPRDLTDVKDNQYSCVIRIEDRDNQHSVLLTGDVEAAAEFLMIKQNMELKSDVVIVPHHGSSSSSTQAFIDATSPRWAIASLSKGNQWGFPSQAVKERYKKSEVQWFDTGDYGQISLLFKRNEENIETQRLMNHPFSYEPWYRQMLRKQVE